MKLRLVSRSTHTPVTLALAKDHLRLSSTDATYDEDLLNKLRAATEYCERSIGGWRCFMAATYKAILREFPNDDGKIELPVPPLNTTSSTGITISYVTSTGGTTTVSSTAFSVVAPTDAPGWIEPAYGETWPTTRDVPGAVKITFPAGYADTRRVPPSVKEAILLKLEQLHDPARVDSEEMDRAIDSLLACHSYGHYS